MRSAFFSLLQQSNAKTSTPFGGFPTLLGARALYRGATGATIGAVPSSALYFGGYEFAKSRLTAIAMGARTEEGKVLKNYSEIQSPFLRLAVHSVSALTGNLLSSLIYVPKEVIKQRLQASSSPPFIVPSVLHTVLHVTKVPSVPPPPLSVPLTTYSVVVSTLRGPNGVRGLYTGYGTTLLRNVPGAIVRFAVYEELKRYLLLKEVGSRTRSKNANDNRSASALLVGRLDPKNPLTFALLGAFAGSFSSFLFTPLDVLKTQLATGRLPPGVGIVEGGRIVMERHGIKGLYAGGGARMIWSSVFGAVGFGCFEFFKKTFGAQNED